MSEESPQTPSPPPIPLVASQNQETPPASKIYLVSYPKIVFLYPTFIAGFIASIVMSFNGDAPLDAENKMATVTTLVFIGILFSNMIVFSFEFPRTTSLTLFFSVVCIVLMGWIISQYSPNFLPFLGKLFTSVKPAANATFYYLFSTFLGIIYMVVLTTIQFDYWEVTPNELLHRHGFLSNLERYPSPNLRISKEINDVFEYLLLRSGRLILQPSNEPRAIILENVLFISRKEEQLTKMLGVLQVSVRA